MKMKTQCIKCCQGLPGGTVDRNLPVNVGENGFSSSLGGFTCPRAAKTMCHNA